jgi:hypothetical protein
MDPAPQLMAPKQPEVPKPPVAPLSIQPGPIAAIGQREETLIQFAAIELEGTLKRG